MNNAASPTYTDLTDAMPAARDSDFTVALDDAMMSLLNNDDMYAQYDGDPSELLFALLVAGVARYAAMTAHDARQLPNAIGCTLQAIGENLED